MQCPACASPVEIQERAGHFRICPYCQTSFVIDRKAARVSGKMAVLAQTQGPLYVGAAGKVGSERFQVLGRIRYGWQSGYWDEWYLRFDDGETGWISEDGDDFSLERWVNRKQTPVKFEDAQPGQRLKLGRFDYHIDEKGIAVCEGGEGQLPFPVEIGEEVRFLDLRHDESFATVEFEDRGMRVFYGNQIDRASIVVDVPREGSAPDLRGVERAATAGSRERIVKQAGRSLTLACDRCGGSLDIAAGITDSIRCKHCGFDLDLTIDRIDCPECDRTIALHGGNDVAQVTCTGCPARLGVTAERIELLSQIKSDKRPKIPFELGQPCTFNGADFVLVGHLRYTEKDGTTLYVSDEFLLWSKKVGYRWLTLEDGHFSFAQEIKGRPNVNWGAKPKTRFPFEGRTYRVFESGKTQLTWVDGELPWVAAVGDRVKYLDATCPPYLLSGEITETEAEWYEARYLTTEEVAQAFQISASRLPKSRGVAPHQPYKVHPLLHPAARMAVVFAIINIVLAFTAMGVSSSSDNVVGQFGIPHEDYSKEFITPSFEITKGQQLCAVELSAPVDNSWLYVDLALIDSEDRVLHEFSTTVQYYHGVQGGESWSEGSRKESIAFKLQDPGEYRWVLAGQAGRGNAAEAIGPELLIIVREGVMLVRWFLIAAILLAAGALIVWFRWLIFEGQRWKSVLEDD